MEYENVTLKTSDGIELDAWYVPSHKDTNKPIVVLHGYPYDKGKRLSNEPRSCTMNSTCFFLISGIRAEAVAATLP